jgi:hypothetical protein
MQPLHEFLDAVDRLAAGDDPDGRTDDGAAVSMRHDMNRRIPMV